MEYLSKLCTYDTHDEKFIGEGGRNSISRVTVTVKGLSEERNETINMVLRQIKPHDAMDERNDPWTIHNVIEELQNRDRLMKMKNKDGNPIFPVVPEVFLDRATGNLICTDLTENGKNYVLSADNKTADDPRPIKGREQPLWKLTPNMGRDMLEQFHTIGKNLTEQHVCIGPNALFVIVNKESLSAKIIMGDCKGPHISFDHEGSWLYRRNCEACSYAASKILDGILPPDEIRNFFQAKCAAVK